MTSNTTPQRHGALAAPRWLIWPLALISALSVATVIQLDSLGCGLFYPISPQSLSAVGFLLGGLGFAVLGGLLIYQQPRNRIGWVTGAIGSLQFVPVLASYTRCGLAGTVDLPGVPIAGWLTINLGTVYFYLLFILLPLTFPTGRFLSRRWRITATAVSGLIFFGRLVGAFRPGEIGPTLGIMISENPLGVDFIPQVLLSPGFSMLNAVLFPGMILLAILSMVLRWRRSRGDVRQQLKWFVYFLSTAMFINIVFFQVLSSLFYPWIVDTVWYGLVIIINFAGFPAVIGIAIFKYGIYDIDLIIRRTLSYSLLTGILALVYFGGVVLLQSILRILSGNPNSPLVTVLSTLGIAALFNPLRARIQGFIDRRFYRQEYNPDLALARFAAAAQDEVDTHRVSDHLLGIIQETLQPRRSSLWIKPIDLPPATHLEDKGDV